MHEFKKSEEMQRMFDEYEKQWEELGTDVVLRKKLLRMYKVSQGCAICGYNKCADALDFHHEGDDKKSSISSLVNRLYSFKGVLKEVKKCIVLCANCHRELHSGENKPKNSKMKA